jgi:hypothetical protein
MSPIEILNAHRPDRPPVDVDQLATTLGLIVIRQRDLGSDIAGMIIRDRRRLSPSGFTIHVNAADNARRQRFTVAHEIGHYVLHRDLIGDGVTDDALYRSSLGAWYERQANRMAADVLMPAELVKQYYRRTRALAPLADAFDVSVDAMRIRVQELGLDRP